MQRHSPSSFRQRLPLTLSAAFESWASRVASGVYDQLLHVEGRLLLLAGEEQLKHARDQMAMLLQAGSEVSLTSAGGFRLFIGGCFIGNGKGRSTL